MWWVGVYQAPPMRGAADAVRQLLYLSAGSAASLQAVLHSIRLIYAEL